MNDIKQKIENDSVLNLVKPFINGYPAYLVGGFIRDLFLGIESNDRDLVIEDVDVEKLSKDIAEKINGHFVPLDTENKIYRIVLEDKVNYVDISSPLAKTIKGDILRRDLTINAVAYSLKNAEFVDFAGGIDDIKNKVIRGISDNNFIDDPLRMLRVFRFYSKFGFKIDEKLLDFIKEHAKKIQYPSKERVNLELVKLFEGKYADLALKAMDKTGLLKEIFEVVEDVKKIPPNPHHHLNLFEHSIEVVRQVQLNYEKADEDVKNHLDSCVYGICPKLAYLKLAAFLHDIGKPCTWKIEEETGKHRFVKHDDIGSKMALPILKNLKFSKKQIAYIQKMIKYHIYPSSVIAQDGASEKSRMRVFRKMEEDTIDVIIIAMSDRLSALGPDIKLEMVERNINGLKHLLETYLETRDSIKPLEKLLDGNEIMQILNITASSQLGNIIKHLKEAQMNGDINTKEEAVEFIKQLSIDNV